MQEIMTKLDEIKVDLQGDLAEQLKKVDEKLDEKIVELREQITTVEAKVQQAPSIIREKAKTVTQDCGRRVLEQFKAFAEDKVPAGKKNQFEVKLWESVEEHAAWHAERKALRAQSLEEASALTGSGSGKGGMVRYQPFFRARRFSNNLRDIAPVYATDGSDFQWRVRVGNSGLSFGYVISQNNSANTEDTVIWQIPLKTLNTVRLAA